MRVARCMMLVGLCLAVTLTGCQKAPPASPAAGSSTVADAVTEALASLTESDRTLAVAQASCPVGGGKLGSMGTPVKVDVQGRTVFLCCEGCRGELEANEAKYLAQLDGKKADAAPAESPAAE